MKLTLAQLNPKIGDISRNVLLLKNALEKASKEGAELVVFSELFLCGYPPRDLLNRPDFFHGIQKGLDEVLASSKAFPGLGILIGLPELVESDSPQLYNSVFLIENGAILFKQRKVLLPFYDVFDEPRYFSSGETQEVFDYKGKTLGILICEDAWFRDAEVPYGIDPVSQLASKGAGLFITVMASPFDMSKPKRRFELFRSISQETKSPVVGVNQVGGNDELLFDGGSLVVDREGQLRQSLHRFEEAVVTVDLAEKNTLAFEETSIADVHDGLVMGIRDYVHKCGFSDVLVGLSGGIDSAVTAALAVEALGASHVMGVGMPSQHSSDHSIDDAKQLAAGLGIRFELLSIKDIYQSFESELSSVFSGYEQDVTEENIQPRIRGTLLMALANKFGSLLLSTGNKSEMAVGYCTLYGDMNGALSVLSDVYKTTVYDLAHYMNRQSEIIPIRTIEKPPSAELKPDQKDSDSLPDYDILDQILKGYIEDHGSAQELTQQGFDASIVKWVIAKVHQNEYKRQQAPPGLKISKKAFGVGRRIPIASHV